MSDDETAAGPPAHFSALVGGVATVVGRRPALLVPFLLAGVVTAAVDVLRAAGAVPTVSQTAIQHGFGRVVFQPVPMPVSALGTAPSAWLGLELFPFLWAGTLELSGACCGALAAVWVIWRVIAIPTGPSRETRAGAAVDPTKLVWRAGRLLAYQFAVTGLLAAFGILSGGAFGPLGIPLLLGFLYAAARLFLVPVGVVAGSGIADSILWSWRQSEGRATTFAGAVVVLGLGGNLLVSVPAVLAQHVGIAIPGVAGSLLATSIVSMAHAVVVGIAASRISAVEM